MKNKVPVKPVNFPPSSTHELGCARDTRCPPAARSQPLSLYRKIQRIIHMRVNSRMNHSQVVPHVIVLSRENSNFIKSKHKKNKKHVSN